MRLKKQRRHRKSVRFYTACCGFRQPFKVLCDGTFVHSNVVHRIDSPDEALANILGAPVKLFTTRCVLEELRRLGNSHSESFAAARNLSTARCEHDSKTSAYNCILDIIGENNPEHFFVGTQDTDLRRKLQEIPSVPVIFGLRNALFLEQPSSFQRQFVKNLEEQRMHMNETERARLMKRTSTILKSADSSDPPDEQDDLGGDHKIETTLLKAKRARNATDTKDTVQFKRKRPKAPNPLSCMKKKKCDTAKPVLQKEKDGDNCSVRSRNRKRKRSRGNKKASEAE